MKEEFILNDGLKAIEGLFTNSIGRDKRPLISYDYYQETECFEEQFAADLEELTQINKIRPSPIGETVRNDDNILILQKSNKFCLTLSIKFVIINHHPTMQRTLLSFSTSQGWKKS